MEKIKNLKIIEFTNVQHNIHEELEETRLGWFGYFKKMKVIEFQKDTGVDCREHKRPRDGLSNKKQDLAEEDIEDRLLWRS